MKLAAIDIGSNAARLQVSSVLHPNGATRFKRIEYLRFPLQLGHDIFRTQCISTEGEKKLIQLLHAFKLLINLYDVDDYMICATSALREAQNQLVITKRIKEAIGLSVNIISGEQEAALIHKAIRYLLDDHYYLHVDVGGGSTEVSFYKGSRKIATRSFNLGAIKLLIQRDTPLTWEEMKVWIHAQRQHLGNTPIGIATGGNIRKLAQLARRGTKKPLALKQLKATKSYLASYTLKERINKLELNPDRAELIVPAAQIYDTALGWGGVKKIIVPDVSLRDGIIRALYERNILA
ncbi:MAG: phosphatase [Roseivirga sp.]